MTRTTANPGFPLPRLAAPPSPRSASRAEPRRREGGGDQPTLRATDPRWVLALRVREGLEGTLLRPAARQRLIRLGGVLGLTAFEANLVIAIVQDNARRGGDLGAAAGSLASVPRHRAATRRRTGWRWATLWTAACLAAEAAVVFYVLH